MRASLRQTLVMIKGVDNEKADKIRAIWHAKDWKELQALGHVEETVGIRGAKRRLIDKVLGTHGVEFLGRNKRTHIPVYYCNTGETYDKTVMFEGNTLMVSDWGSWVEQKRIIEADR